MQDDDSLIKARYARTILRVARPLDPQTAARLVNGLVRDIPQVNERPEVKRLHLAAIEAFARLAKVLDDPIPVECQQRWDDAMDAAKAWLRAVGD
jgi:hypothetical protein